MTRKLGIRDLLQGAWYPSARGWIRYALSLTHDVDEAEEIVSEALFKSLCADPKFRTSRNANNYIFTAIRGLFSERRIQRQRRHKLLERLRREPEEVASSALQLALEHDEREERRFRTKLIHNHLVHLPEEVRLPFRMRYLDQPTLTYREIADALNISVSTSYARVQRALALLIEAVDKERDE